MGKTLAGKVALVTGGSRGIGAAAARALAEEGADVAISYTASAEKAEAATRASFPGLADYAATKAAVVGYTKGWARDLGPKGITVNVVQAGPVDTDMNPADGAFAPAMTAATALGRYGRPEEIAAAIVFLASPAASYVTGASLDVDGGFNA